MHIKPKKSLGQNFLIDPNIRRKIIQSCELLPTDTVLEIGSGRGELTKSLAGQVKRVVALELDGRLIETLENNLRDYPNVSILNTDVLKVDLGPVINNIGKGELVVIGNIPYYITTPIIERLFSYKDAIDRIFLTVQKEFARRIAAPPGSKEYGAFSCFVQYHAIPEILFTIKRTCFRPAPKPDSAFIKLTVLSSPPFKVKDEARLFKIIRLAFGQRRKTLRNSLEPIVPQEKLRRFFEDSSFDRNIRPEDLSLEDFIRLANI
ncbi:MAG: 16S rRNA (adenine(1518)-N(6)/adenine(1519)-N(6))-dimethyltransferase RsmA [Candidatus Omnitrophica bacterium]|nr:16S rRNA (adenine(1518)-N(6)/adenine(1519)-N(6))-dimethyltransferase RsmA [Candidatus Omnitrophota bacterium]